MCLHDQITWKEGDTFTIDREVFRVTRIEYQLLVPLQNGFFRCEGSDSLEQFERIDRSLHSFWRGGEGVRALV